MKTGVLEVNAKL